MKNTPCLLLFPGLFFLFFYSSLQAQKLNVRVLITGEQGIIPEAQLIVKDTSKYFITGTIAEQGRLEVAIDTPGFYIFSFSSVGYSQKDTLVLLQTSADFGVVYLQTLAGEMKEVNVVAQRPLFEKTTDGTRMNVGQTMLSKSINSAEVLTRTPGLTIVAGKVNVNGRGEAIIVINGKETTLESFKSIPAGDLESVEVLTNPDAKYDAKGKAVVIVKLKKYARQGYLITGNLSTTFSRGINNGYSRYIHYAPNIALNFRKDKWSYTSYYGNEYGLNWSENIYSTYIESQSGNYVTNGYYHEDNLSKGVHYYKAGIGYAINDRSELSLQYDGMHHYFELDVIQNGDYTSPWNELTRLRMQNDATTTLSNHSINLNYSLRTDTMGSNLFIASQFNRFENQLLDQITERVITTVEDNFYNRKNDGFNEILLSTFQMDYVKNRKNSVWESGFKYSYASNDGRIRFYSKLSDEVNYMENTAVANSTEYTEQIPAVYVSYKYTSAKWRLRAGIRAEYTDVESRSNKYHTTILDTNYLNLFPSAGVHRLIGSKAFLSANYSRKINRPVYQDLDPFLWYLDSLTSIQGNPALKPEYLHQIELKVGYNSFVLRGGYTISEQTIWAITAPGSSGENSMRYIKENLQHRYTTTIAFDAPIEKGIYSGYHSMAVNSYKFNDNRPEFKTGRIRPQLYVYSFHQFAIKNWFSVDGLFEYYGASNDGYTRRAPYYYGTLGISKSFLNEALQLQLTCNDIARSARFKGVRTINTYTNDYNQRFSSHYFRITITYNFNKLKGFNYRNKSVNETEFNRIKR